MTRCATGTRGTTGTGGRRSGRRRTALIAGATLGLLAGLLAVTPAPADAGAPGPATASTPDIGSAPTAAPAGTTGSAAGGEAAEGRGSGFTPSTQAASLQLYQDLYLREADDRVGWTGSIGSCNPGTTTAAFKAGVLRRINYFRAMAGVPDDITFTADYNALAQRTALMMAANQQLSHEPPASWRCYTTAGGNAAGGSNLSMGSYGAASIATFMRDPGSGNSVAGHRRWLLHPPTRNMGTGDIPGSTIPTTTSALFVFDTHIFDDVPPTRDGFVAWPPPGFVPKTVMYQRWSFGRDGANFANATVTLTRNGNPVSVTRYAPASGYGINTLVWDIPASLAGDNGLYHVRVAGVSIGGVRRTFDYDVTVFNPDAPPPPVTIISPENESEVARGATVLADYSCAMPGVVSCVGPVPDGSPIDTSTLGARSFTVTATDGSGAQASETHRYTVVDGTKPSVRVTTPPEEAVYLQGQPVTADYACADEVGGSGLASCTAPVANGAAINTSVLGQRPFTVTATDNAGNQRSVDRGFKVSTRPDAEIGSDAAGPFVGDGVYAATSTPGQAAAADVGRGESATFFVRIGNDANAAATFTLDGIARDATGYRVSYLVGRTDITAAVDAGTYTLPSLAPGATTTVKIKVTATTTAPRGSTAKVDLTVGSTGGPPALDTVRAKVTTT